MEVYVYEVCAGRQNLFALPVDLLVPAYHLEEQQLHARVRSHLGVEGSREQMSLAHQNREAIALGENFDTGSHLRNLRCADEDHLKRTARQLRGLRQNCGVDL